jgi:DNA-binding protein HU-beta
MNKQELIAEVEKVLPDRKTAAAAVDSLLARISLALQGGDTVTLSGFGTFKVAQRQARTGRNPKTGDAIAIAAHRVVRFVPGKTLRDHIAE